MSNLAPARAAVEDSRPPETVRTATVRPDPTSPPGTASDARQVAEWLALFADPEQALELRAPDWRPPRAKEPTNLVRRFRGTVAGRAAAAREALKLSAHAPAVYLVMNPVRIKLLDRPGGKGAKAGDITRRRRLLFDCDPIRPGNSSSTDAEKAEALRVAVAIRDHLRAAGWPEPILADSGNGWHLVYSIDLPVIDGGLVQRCILALKARFDTAAVQVDRKVFDAPRLVKLYGTMTRKGQATADRPHRPSRIVEVPAQLVAVDRASLEALAAEAPDRPAAEVASPVHPAKPPRRATAPEGTTTIPLAVRIERGRKLLEACEPAIEGQHGSDKLIKVAANLVIGLDLPRDDGLALLREVYNPKCVPPWPEAQLSRKVDEACRLETRPRGWLLDAPRANGNGRRRPGTDGAAATIPPNDRDGDGDGGAGGGRIAVEEPDPPVNEAPDDPHRLARAVLAEFRHRDGPTLAWYRDEFYAWDGVCYRTDAAFLGRLVRLVKAEADRQNREAIRAHRDQAARDQLAPAAGRPAAPPKAVKVTRRLIADVVQALASMVAIDQDAEAPFWIRRRPDDPDPLQVIAAANGLADLSKDRPALRPHTPRLFSTHALPYPFRADAPPPAGWLRFLADQWADDPASVRELQKWFGYVLTPDTSHEKIMLLIGPPRSGRSTIKDLMAAVVGRRNVASTSAIALADRFGLEPLLGKTLAIMGDARTGDTHDAVVMMDRVLRISGQDPVEVNRKGRPILQDVFMRARLVIVSNEVPNFRDPSKAIVARYVVLHTPTSFEGREDFGLKRRLLDELPGILNWAIAGRAMLAEDGRFTTPSSAEDLVADAKALASPAAEWVADRCELGPEARETIDDLWADWGKWCEATGQQRGNRQLFGRNLRAAVGYKIRTYTPRAGERRWRGYVGIRLKPEPIPEAGPGTF